EYFEFTDIASTEVSLGVDPSNRNNLLIQVMGTTDTIKVQDYFSNANNYLDRMTFSDGVVWDQSTIISNVHLVLNGTEDTDSLTGYSTIYNVLSDSEELHGLGGNDSIKGLFGDDTLYGDAGDDSLDGGIGNDVLVGGVGNDTLFGGAGNDTYHFSKGFGQDTVITYSGNAHNSGEKIVFTDIASNEIVFEIEGENTSNLLIRHKGTRDVIRVENYFASDVSYIDEIEFFDDVVWLKDDIEELVELKTEKKIGTEADDSLKGNAGVSDVIKALGGNDIVNGLSGNDYLDGGNGNDKLYGYEDDDILVGGAGDDTLMGGMGDDIYRFSRGFGKDIVTTGNRRGHYDGEHFEFKDIASTEVSLGVDPYSRRNLLLTVEGTDDAIRVIDYFSYDNNCMDSMTFSDGVVWNKEDIASQIHIVINGTNNKDTLNGVVGIHNVLSDSEEIHGYGGNDVISGKTGDDILYGDEGYDVIAGNEGNDTLYGGADTDDLLGNEGDDYLDGGSGNDRIYGNEGDDILIGGEGIDTLEGGLGDDIYRFSKGFGQDIVTTGDSRDGHYDGEHFEFIDIASTEVSLGVDPRSRGNLLVTVEGTDDAIRVIDYFSYDNNCVDSMTFSDGVVWNKEDIASQIHIVLHGAIGDDKINGLEGMHNVLSDAEEIHGHAGKDVICGKTGDDILYGDEGNDQLAGNEGNDTLYGGADSDYLLGDEGDDILVGESGNDTLTGGLGDDVYRFSKAFGKDIIKDTDVIGSDTIQMSYDYNEITFKNVGMSLVIETEDGNSIIVSDQSKTSDFVIDKIEVVGNESITAPNINLLIQSMSEYCSTHGVTWTTELAKTNEEVQTLISQYYEAN
ncbi:MAG: hypothetical protein JXO44_13165, partial [Clostridia bacterium]|nr:hypothetical protein [Clostridia bacterium]